MSGASKRRQHGPILPEGHLVQRLFYVWSRHPSPQRVLKGLLIGMRSIVSRCAAPFVVNILLDVSEKKKRKEKKKRDKHESFSLLLIHWQQLESQSNFSRFNICGTAERRERTDIIRGSMKGGMKLHPSTSVVLNSWELWWMSLG